MREPCIFCAIATGSAAADVVHATDRVLVFRDIQPQAPVHLLAIPRTHVATLNEADPATVAELYGAAQTVAQREGFAEDGYRTVINVQRRAGQSVFHLHLHILAGRSMRWPPG